MYYAAVLCLISLISPVHPATARAVTHEDIRDAIMSFVHMFRDLTDKLERHEHRERQLGEQLKRALSSLDKRERMQDSRLDSILSSVHSLEQKIQQFESSDKNLKEKDLYTLDTGHLQSWMENLEGKLTEQDQSKELGRVVNSLEVALALKYNSLEEGIKEINHAVRRLEQQTLSDIKAVESNVLSHTQRLVDEMLFNSSSLLGKIHTNLDNQAEFIQKNTDDISRIGQDMAQRGDLLFSELMSGFQHLNNEIKVLNKVEQVLVQTADNVMDTKRRVEYGVHQILLDVSELVKLQGKDINSTVNTRFNDISTKILDNQNEGLTNLSSKVETELSQVWRQIGTMYKQMAASAGALDSLQKQTEVYVNGSLTTMNGMQDTVGQITDKMNEVDENLNFLLGRLSLVTQEFNITKNALAVALDNIRGNFKQVQEKVKNSGPGPNPISSDEASQDNVP